VCPKKAVALEMLMAALASGPAWTSGCRHRLWRQSHKGSLGVRAGCSRQRTCLGPSVACAFSLQAPLGSTKLPRSPRGVSAAAAAWTLEPESPSHAPDGELAGPVATIVACAVVPALRTAGTSGHRCAEQRGTSRRQSEQQAKAKCSY